MSVEQFEELQGIVAEELGLPFEEVFTTTVLTVDSLSLMEIIVRVEAEFDINISDAEAAAMKTFADLFQVIEAKS